MNVPRSHTFIGLSISLLSLLLSTGAALPDHSKTQVWISTRDKNLTEGIVEVHANPDEIFDVVTHFEGWVELFSDVTSIKLLGKEGDKILFRFDSKIMGHPHTFEFHSNENRELLFRIVDPEPGIELWSKYRLEPVGDGHRTQVKAQLYLEMRGFWDWIVPDQWKRNKMEKKLYQDLEDIRQWFEKKERR